MGVERGGAGEGSAPGLAIAARRLIRSAVPADGITYSSTISSAPTFWSPSPTELIKIYKDQPTPLKSRERQKIGVRRSTPDLPPGPRCAWVDRRRDRLARVFNPHTVREVQLGPLKETQILNRKSLHTAGCFGGRV